MKSLCLLPDREQGEVHTLPCAVLLQPTSLSPLVASSYWPPGDSGPLLTSTPCSPLLSSPVGPCPGSCLSAVPWSPWPGGHMAGSCPPADSLSARHLRLGPQGHLGQSVLCCEGCLVPWRLRSSIPGLHPLDASSSPWQTCGDQKHLQTLPDIPEGLVRPIYPSLKFCFRKTSPRLRTPCRLCCEHPWGPRGRFAAEGSR